MMELFCAIAGRRSIRKYSGDDVCEEDLRRMLDAGRMAPSWVNFQVWEVVVVRDPKTKSALAATLPDTNPARGAVESAPVVLVACGRKGESGCKKGELATVLGDWLMFDVALFLNNVTLAAYALGYGTVHVGYFDQKRAAKLIGVPDQVQVVELLPIGRPLEPAKYVSPRRAIEDFVHREKY